MKITFIVTFANEPIEQIDWCLSNLRKSYPKANVILISDGGRIDYGLPQKYNTVFVAGEKLKIISRGALWWKRFLTEALKTDADVIFKIDPDTKIWRRLNYFPDSDFFGMLTNKGEIDEHIQGGCQGFSRSFAEKIIDSKITEDENYKDLNFWGSPAFKAAHAAPDYFSTDWSMIHIAKRLNATREKHTEILSIWVPFSFLKNAPPNWTMKHVIERYQMLRKVPSEIWTVFVEEKNPDLKYAITHPHYVSRPTID